MRGVVIYFVYVLHKFYVFFCVQDLRQHLRGESLRVSRALHVELSFVLLIKRHVDTCAMRASGRDGE